jgi:hypothetical protein
MGLPEGRNPLDFRHLEVSIESQPAVTRRRAIPYTLDVIMYTRWIAPLAALTLTVSVANQAFAAPRQQDTKPIVFGKPKAYEHESGWFKLDIPSNWTAKDSSKDDEQIVTFSDPTGNAAIVVDIFTSEKTMADADMSALTTKFIREKFSSYKKFSISKAQVVRKGLISLKFGYQQPLGTKSIPMSGESFMRNHEDALYALVTYLVPTEQAEKAKPKIYEVIDTLEVDADALNKQSQSTGTAAALGELALYNHPKKVFSVKLPETWEITDNSKSGIVSMLFEQPGGDSFAMVEVLKNAKGPYKQKDLGAAITKYVQDTIGANVEGFQSLDPTVNGPTSATQAFNFTVEVDGKEKSMTGVVLLLQNGTNVGYLRVIMPTENVDANVETLNTMGDSFTVSKTAKF